MSGFALDQQTNRRIDELGGADDDLPRDRDVAKQRMTPRGQEARMVGLMARSQTGTLTSSSIEVACSCLKAALLPWALVAVTLTRQRQSPVYSALRLEKNICAAWTFCAPMTARRGQRDPSARERRRRGMREAGVGRSTVSQRPGTLIASIARRAGATNRWRADDRGDLAVPLRGGPARLVRCRNLHRFGEQCPGRACDRSPD